ncbi:hypothetical protein [Burkholderia ubonensis]|nr:hypothetical protein [Burkholderia ubonensis]
MLKTSTYISHRNAASQLVPEQSPPESLVQLGLGSKVLNASNFGNSYKPDFAVPAMRPISKQVNFQSLLFRVRSGEVIASPERRDYPVAIYGISNSQKESGRFICHNLKMNNVASIARFNKQLGIVHYRRGEQEPGYLISEFAEHIEKAIDNTLIERANEPAPIVKEWARYLGRNKDRLDAFFRLNKLLSRVPEQERLALAEQFVRKNTSGCCDSKSLAKCLVNLIDDFECKTLRDVDAVLEKSRSSIRDSLQEDLAELVVKHFFRNSSKLGLTFFAEHGASIIFGWDNDGRKLDIDAIQDKPWKKEGERRFGAMYEPITYSEVRSILRAPEFFANKVSKISFEREAALVLDGSDYHYSGVAKLAGSLQSNEWVAIPREMDFVGSDKNLKFYSINDALRSPDILRKLVKGKNKCGVPLLTAVLLEGRIEVAKAFIEEMKVAYAERDIDQSRFMELLYDKKSKYSSSILEKMLRNRSADEIKVFVKEIKKAFKERCINFDQFRKLMTVDYLESHPIELVDALIHEMKAACDEKLIDKAQFAELMEANFATLSGSERAVN